MSLACVVLAAGGSTRLGTPKQLLLVDGQPLIRRAVEAACATSCEHVAVVLGASATEVTRAIGHSRATTLFNAEWSSAGMSSSLHIAVHWAQELAVEALLLVVCDQPALATPHLSALLAAYKREQRSVASRYQGALGVPALIEARHFSRLLAIEGDRGAAPLLRSGVDVSAIDWPEGAIDLDTELDVARFRAAGRA